MKKGFTLAETLITIGIIGIVAAMTLPTLIQNYHNRIVKTRLKHFYSTINQGIKMSELENGLAENWDTVPSDSDDILLWTNKYLTKYIKTVNQKTCTAGTKNGYKCGCLYFENGSGVAIHNHAWFFYPNAKYIGKATTCGKEHFTFDFIKSAPTRIEPFNSLSNDKMTKLKYPGGYGCNASNSHWCSGWYCTRIIQLNDWKIPKDYPFKVN